MITITAQVEIQCLTDAELATAIERVGLLNLLNAPVVNETTRRVSFTLIQLVESLG